MLIPVTFEFDQQQQRYHNRLISKSTKVRHSTRFICFTFVFHFFYIQLHSIPATVSPVCWFVFLSDLNRRLYFTAYTVCSLFCCISSFFPFFFLLKKSKIVRKRTLVKPLLLVLLWATLKFFLPVCFLDFIFDYFGAGKFISILFSWFYWQWLAC